MTRVQSLVRELRPQKLHGAAKQNKKNKKQKSKGMANGSGILTKKVHFAHLHKLSKFDTSKTQKLPS